MPASSHNTLHRGRRSEEPPAIADTQGQDRLLPQRSSWSRHRKLVVAGLALGGVLVGFIWIVLHFRGALMSVDRDRLTIATVQRTTFIRDIAAEGQVVASVSPTLYAPYGGTVTLKVHAGDVVDKDQLLAVIVSPDLAAKVAQEEATLLNMQLQYKRAQLEATRKLSQARALFEQADIDRITAQRELDRSRKAFDLGAYSELQLLRAEDALRKAQFASQQAKASLNDQPKQNSFDVDSTQALLDRQDFLVKDLHRQVDELQIRSPVTGNVGQVNVADRASLAKDSPLLTVVDLSALELQINVPEGLARDLAVGMPASLEGAGRSWQGTIGAVSPQVINGQVVARVRFREQKPTGLRQSQRLSARIFIERRENVLTVDRGPFMEQDGGRFVYVVRDNKAIRRPVRLGASSVEKVEVISGLKQADQIVVSGTEALRSAPEVILSH
jgi:HlyD family secretion protein